MFLYNKPVRKSKHNRYLKSNSNTYKYNDLAAVVSENKDIINKLKGM